MKAKRRNLLCFINSILSLIVVAASFGQPYIPKGNIPPGVPADVKEQIERLYNYDPIERGYAADNLRNMGEKATPAVPFLIAILSDRAALQWTSKPGTIGPGMVLLLPVN